MCGIAGIADTTGTPVDVAVLRAMTSALAHRGPDGDGFHVDGAVGLGHRRLAIIDLVTGTQPMASAAGTAWITFNGEIYNFRELRAELGARGYRFRTTSDTEVVLAAYETWGARCLPRLRGMFAFAIWDGRRRRMLLARDRVGIKPLVYAWDGRRLAFASEPKALLRDRALPREIDGDALRDYLTFLYVPAPRTIFRSIAKLPPASYLVLDVDHGRLDLRRYWDLALAPDETRSEPAWLDGLAARLDDAVRSHLVSDVPVGAFLSGGVDSSTVVGLMAAARAEPVRTFSIGFDEPEFDELPYARQVARRHGTDHVELVVKPDALEMVSRLHEQLDEPFADASAIPTYAVARLAREHVTVALSGDGGDETFAGYHRYARALALHDRLDRRPARLLRPLLRLAAACLPDGMRGQGTLDLLGADAAGRYFRLMTYQRSATLRRLLTADARARIGADVSDAPFRRLMTEASTPDHVAALQYVDVRSYLPDDILAKVDRTSMAVSLEARVPLLDHVLMEYVATIPTRLKLRGGDGKAILKRAMADRLPAEVLHRRKMGFGVPLARWCRAELAGYVRDVLHAPRARARGIFEPAAVTRLLAEHDAGRDRSSQIWSLLCFEEWARRWLDR